MYFKIFLVQLLCTAAVYCRTSQDVINDFEPVFQARHDSFTEIQKSFELDANHYFQLYDNYIQEEKKNLLNELSVADEKITKDTTKYLEDTGMIGKPEKIIHCTNSLETNKSEVVIGFAKAGTRLCSQLGVKNTTKLWDFYKDITTKLANEHKILEVTREECVKLTDPFEVQTCVINDLYTFYIPYIQDVKSAIKMYIQEIANGVTSAIYQSEECLAFVKENIRTDAQQAIDDFKLCVWWQV